MTRRPRPSADYLPASLSVGAKELIRRLRVRYGCALVEYAPMTKTATPDRQREQPMSLDLEDFFENGAVGLHIVGSNGLILRANRAELDLLGYEQHEYVGMHIADFHADQSVIQDILGRLSRGEKIDRYPARLRAKDGSLRHVQITSSAKFGEDGFAYTRCFTVDVTDAVLAEEKAHDWYRQLLDALPAAVYTTDIAGKITYYNEAAVELAGRRPVVGKDEWCVSWRLYHPDGPPMPLEDCPMAITLREQRPIRGAEAILERPDGTRATFVPYPTPLRDRDTGEMIGAVNMLVDITDRKRAEETEKLLIGELNHRIKNTLANVEALARHTLRRAPSSTEFVESFSARLQSLARIHGLLTENSWSGAELHGLIRDQLISGPFDQQRITCNGPEVQLEPDAALHLAMVLHELATNSHKYGALSVPDGSVRLSWQTKNSVLLFQWLENSGRSVTTPIRRGFGTTLIEQSLAAHGGTATLTCGATGFIWDLLLPLPRVQLSMPAQASPDRNSQRTLHADQGSDSSKSVVGKRVLVVEDEPLIALEQIANLEEMGARAVGPAGTIARALHAIETEQIDVALLDANLSGEGVDEVAAALTRKNIPFAFVTGYGRNSLPRPFQTAPVLNKPCTADALRSMVRQLIQPAAAVLRLRDRL